MSLLWTEDTASVDPLQYALGGSTSQLTSAARVFRALEENPSHDLVVIGADIDLDEACAVAERQRVEHPDLGVILLRHRVDVTALTQALRSGVREVIDADDTTALAGAARRSRELTAQLRGGTGAVGHGKVVTVFSAKGGVGKTMLATNLALQLAATGSETLLLDLDVMFGDVAISLQLSPETSLADAIAMSGHLDAAGLASLATKHESSGLHVVAAPSDPAQSELLTGSLVSELLRIARTNYRYVVVDTPPNISEHVLAAFDTSDVTLLVATLDIPAVKNLRLAINTLHTLGADASRQMIVLNRATDKVGLSTDEVEAALKAPVAHTVPSSLDVAAAANKGVPLTIGEPKHPVSQAIGQIADDVRRRLGEDVEPSKKRRFGRR